MNFKFIYKICTKTEWSEAKNKNKFIGSNKDLEDGYIHFSGEDKVKETLQKFYSKQRNLILLKVATLKLDNLLWEQTSDGNMFPHLYSSLDVSNVVDEIEITLRDDGSHVLPDNF